MFYGYKNEKQLKEMNPDIAEYLISIAKTKEINVCTRGKQCTGSIDGKNYMYADGSSDQGQTVVSCRAEHKGNVYGWINTPFDIWWDREGREKAENFYGSMHENRELCRIAWENGAYVYEREMKGD